MTGQKKKRRITRIPCLHRRRMLVLKSAFTLVILVSCCQPAAGDDSNSNSNSNINKGRQPEELLSAEVTHSDGDVHASTAPGKIPIGDILSGPARSGDVEGAEDDLETSVATPGVAFYNEEEEDDGSPAAAGQALAAEVPASSAEAVVENPATQAETSTQRDVGDTIQHEAISAAASAAAAAPYPATGTADVGGQRLAAAAAAAAATTDAANIAQGFQRNPGSHQHDTNVVVVGQEAGGSEGGVSQAVAGLDAGRENTKKPGGVASATRVDSPVDGMGIEDEGKSTGRRVEGRPENEAGDGRDKNNERPAGTDQLVEETKVAAKGEQLPTTDRHLGEAGASDDLIFDSHDSSEVMRSGASELSVPAAVADDDADGASDSAASDTDGDAVAGLAAVTLAPESEEQQHQQRQQLVQSLASQKEPSLGTQDSAAVETTGSPSVGDIGSKTDSCGSDGGDGSGDGTAVGVAAGAEPFPPPGTTTSAEAAKESQTVESPGGPSSPTGKESASTVASSGDVRPLYAEGSRGGDGNDSDGVGGGGGSEGEAEYDDVANRASAGPEAGHGPGDSGVERDGVPRNQSSTSRGRRSSSGRDEPREYEAHSRHVGPGDTKEVGEGREGVNWSDGGGGVGGVGGIGDDGTGDTSNSGSGRGGGGTDLPRGSPEEMAQRVRDMEAELVRKLLAEEDAKSLLDIWVERAREYVLTQTVPPTDAECDFNWSRLRCEPKCTCGARLRFGDYTPGRACRLLHPWERNLERCGGGADGDVGDGNNGGGGGGAWDPSDEPALRRVAAAAAGALGKLRRAYQARVAPPSDSECSFSLETRRCEPQSLCRLRFRWGDLTLSSSCRLAGGGD